MRNPALCPLLCELTVNIFLSPIIYKKKLGLLSSQTGPAPLAWIDSLHGDTIHNYIKVPF